MSNNSTSPGFNKAATSMVVSVIISVPIISLNLFTLFIMIMSKTLRKIRHAPVVSFILASAIQSMFVLPIYIHKTIEDLDTHRQPWICDLYRFPYFFTQHIIKLSLFVNSIDRLVALKYPYRYAKLMNRNRVLRILTALWFFTLIVDSIPFFLYFGEKKSNCYYTPTREWGLSVILLFDLTPFITIIVIYIIIWRIAAQVIWKIESQKRAVRSRGMGTKFRGNPGFRSTANDRDDLTILQANDSSTTEMGKKTSITNTRVRIATTRGKNRTRGSPYRFSWEMKATRTSVIVCAAYAVCWMPMGIFYFIDHLCASCLSDDVSYDIIVIKIAIKCICLGSSILLPLVYCWITKEFRREVMKLFCKKGYYRKEIFVATKFMLIDSTAAVIPTNGLTENFV